MIDPHVADPRLAEAFRAWSDGSETECSGEMRERIWKAVTGELPPAERQDVIDMTAADPACAEAWRIAVELWRASGHAVAAGADDDQPGAAKTRFWTPRWLAAAAGLLLATTAGAIWILNRPATDVYRATGGFAFQSLVPADATLPRSAFRLRWTAGPQGSRYELRVTTEDLRPLTTVADSTVPEFVVPPARLEGVPSAAAILWQVEALLPDGGRATSRTFVTHLE